MKQLLSLIILLVLASIGFSGTVSGTLDYPDGTVADTFLIIVTDQFEDLMSAALGSIVYPFDYSVEYAFSDTAAYYAFAGLTSAATLIPMSGDPAGVYPESPFHTVDGMASEIDIPIAESADVEGYVRYSGSYDNVYVNFYDLYMAYTIGDTVIEIANVEVDGEGHFLLEDCPTGPKAVMAYDDENGNMEYDEGEPFTWLQNDLMGVLVVGGGYEAIIDEDQLPLDLFFVKESNPRPQVLQMVAAPNPFNGAVNLIYQTDETAECRIDIFDSRGVKVNTLFDGIQEAGSHVAYWDGEDQFGQSLPTGIYTVKLSSAINDVSTKIIYVK